MITKDQQRSEMQNRNLKDLLHTHHKLPTAEEYCNTFQSLWCTVPDSDTVVDPRGFNKRHRHRHDHDIVWQYQRQCSSLSG